MHAPLVSSGLPLEGVFISPTIQETVEEASSGSTSNSKDSVNKWKRDAEISIDNMDIMPIDPLSPEPQTEEPTPCDDQVDRVLPQLTDDMPILVDKLTLDVLEAKSAVLTPLLISRANSILADRAALEEDLCNYDYGDDDEKLLLSTKAGRGAGGLDDEVCLLDDTSLGRRSVEGSIVGREETTEFSPDSENNRSLSSQDSLDQLVQTIAREQVLEKAREKMMAENSPMKRAAVHISETSTPSTPIMVKDDIPTVAETASIVFDEPIQDENSRQRDGELKDKVNKCCYIFRVSLILFV